jgi:hypothetical protein
MDKVLGGAAHENMCARGCNGSNISEVSRDGGCTHNKCGDSHGEMVGRSGAELDGGDGGGPRRWWEEARSNGRKEKIGRGNKPMHVITWTRAPFITESGFSPSPSFALTLALVLARFAAAAAVPRPRAPGYAQYLKLATALMSCAPRDAASHHVCR